ncbi:MAG: PAS domain-containing sensor histidine kinase [Prolixibacteraceae bacterium]
MKPTYKDLEKQLAELKQANEILKQKSKSDFIYTDTDWHFLFEDSLNGYAFCEMIYENDNPTDFKYLKVNSEFEQLTGLQGISGQKFTELFPGINKEQPEVIRLYGSVASTGIPQKLKLFFTPLKSHLTISVLSPKKGYFIALFDNISKRQEAEIKLKEEEEKYKHLIRNSFDMIVLLDSQGIQRYVSESCEKILGFEAHELINIPVIESMIHPEDQVFAKAEFEQILNNSGTGGLQYRHRHKNGHWIYLEAFGTNQLKNPNIKSIVLNVRDITERKKTEHKLKTNEARLNELNATKDKFLSIIAHDLRSPFNSIVGFCDLLSYQVKNQDYQGLEKYATIIQNSSQLAMDLLMNLLEWSRSQTGKIGFNPEYFELVSLIRELTELFTEPANQKSIQILTNFPPYVAVYADRAMLSTILRNLISNALKFSYPESKIEISVVENTHQIEVAVIDFGVGIHPEDLEKLFRIEEGFSTQGTQDEKGTGLGLILCKEFVEKHQGKIWVESEEGQGSIFRFTLPNQL